MQDSLINQGLTLMLAGMGTVLAFLTVLVAAMSLLSAVVKRLQVDSQDIKDDEVVAITAAIREHRRQKRTNNSNRNL